VTISVARGRHRVHREHLVAGGHERRDEQAPIGLDPYDNVTGIFYMSTHEPVEAGNALNPFGESAATHAFSVFVF
jgi:hypothetical protein